jgi:acylglycerol lipase
LEKILLIKIKRVIESTKKMATEAFILKESAYFSLRALKSLLVLISAMFMVLLLPFRGRRRVSPVEKEEKIQNHECCHHHHHRKGAVVRVPAKIVPWKSAGGGSGVGVVAMKVMDHVMRRELAIRRVLEDGDEKCMREYWLFGTKRGDTIFTQCWTPLYVKIRYVYMFVFFNIHSFMIIIKMILFDGI